MESILIRKNCPMRHEYGNCLPLGGFCLSVNAEICEALHQAYQHGYQNGRIDSVEAALKRGDKDAGEDT